MRTLGALSAGPLRARAHKADDGGKTKTADAGPPGRGSTSVTTSQGEVLRCLAQGSDGSAASRKARTALGKRHPA